MLRLERHSTRLPLLSPDTGICSSNFPTVPGREHGLVFKQFRLSKKHSLSDVLTRVTLIGLIMRNNYEDFIRMLVFHCLSNII